MGISLTLELTMATKTSLLLLSLSVLFSVTLGQSLEDHLESLRGEKKVSGDVRQGYDFSWGGHDYYLGWEAGHTWESSRSTCKSKGSGWDLAVVTSSSENNAIESTALTYLEAEQGDLALGCFYLGGFNIDSSSSMDWVTWEAASYFNWSAMYEEPNDMPGSCLYICVENMVGISGEWGDKACSVTGTTKYVCEKS